MGYFNFGFLISTSHGRSVLECWSRGTKNLGSCESDPLLEKVTCLCLFLSSRDYLLITNEKNRVFGKYFGHMTGKTILVSGKYALMKFHSDGKAQTEDSDDFFSRCATL